MWRILVVFVCLVVTECRGFAPSPGHRNPEPRIVGGDPVDIAEHLHQLSVQPYHTHSCAGSIIARNWAVTAAHCTLIPEHFYRIGAGGNYWQYLTWYNVSRFIRHPLYNSTSNDYDIALIEIEGEFQYGETVQSIKLPDRELASGETVNITGWGRISEIGEHSDELLVASISIVDRSLCHRIYTSIPSHPKSITSRMICVGDLLHSGRDSCQGDSGGPLSANGTLYNGIVSWGRGCGTLGIPGVYTDVAHLRGWILRVLAENPRA